MKRKTTRPEIQLPEEMQQEQERLNLSSDATAEEKLYVIEHYWQRTRNLIENLAMLRHLGLTETAITDVLNGGADYIHGEVQSLEHSTVKVVCAYARVHMKEICGKWMVCLDDKPVEAYIKLERRRQDELQKEAERPREDLVREIKSLRRELKSVSEMLRRSEELTDAWMRISKRQ